MSDDALDAFFSDPTVEEPTKQDPTQGTNADRDDPQRDYPDPIYKKWFRTSAKSGFLTLDGWLEAGKISVDIGEVTGSNVSSTKVWSDAMELATFLRSVAFNVATTNYPVRRGADLPESFSYYGGAEVNGKAVSRILKVGYWGPSDSPDPTAFSFKAGHFAASISKSGAFIPNMSDQISANIIKVSRAEIAQMSYRLDLYVQRFAMLFQGDPFKALNGNFERRS